MLWTTKGADCSNIDVLRLVVSMTTLKLRLTSTTDRGSHSVWIVTNWILLQAYSDKTMPGRAMSAYVMTFR